MTEQEVTEKIRQHGWDHAVNTGKEYDGYTVYKCLEKDMPGVVLTTGMPTYVLVKDDEMRDPKNDDEYFAIMRLVNGATELNMADFEDDEEETEEAAAP